MGMRNRAAIWVGRMLLACLVCWLVIVPAWGQDDGDAPIPTFRVYTDLLQIPTLVLDSIHHRPIPGLAESRFRVSIDAGPKNRVPHVRLEGEDPIALAILVDTAHIAAGSRSRLVDAIARLMPGSLRAGDTVSLYKLDCQLSRVMVERPTTPAGMREAAELLFGKHKDQASGGAEPCRTQWNLVDSIVSAVQGIQDEPSRRVLLVVSDGQDRGSRTTWDAARFYAMTHGVAIFASVQSLSLNLPILGRRGVMGLQAAPSPTDLPQVCEMTGGMAMADPDAGIVQQMHDFLVLVRNRYIVEMPPPPAGELKTHIVVVSVEKLDAFIRTAGVSYSLPEPDSTEDPNAIRTAPSEESGAGSAPPNF